MSGGLWNYKNELKENYRSMKVSKVVDALIRVFHEIDWAESWDTDTYSPSTLQSHTFLSGF